MSEIDAALAELRALREHVTALNAELASKGFVMASDTRSRLSEAESLIVTAEEVGPGQVSAWIADATSLAGLLRSEAGLVGA